MKSQDTATPIRSGLSRQFAHPSGLLGRLVGYVMAYEHRKLHRAVLDRLKLGPDDSVLEIGFGSGTTIGMAANKAKFVAGVEVSTVMLDQARRRNREGIRSGKIDLRLGSAISLPYPDRSFSAVFEVNSLHHWEDPKRGLAEVRRVLHPGGRILLSLRDGCGDTVNEQVDFLEPVLAGLGFKDLRTEAHHLDGHGGILLTAQIQDAPGNGRHT